MGKLSWRFEEDKYLVFTYPDAETDLKVDVQFEFNSADTVEVENYYGSKITCYSVGDKA